MSLVGTFETCPLAFRMAAFGEDRKSRFRAVRAAFDQPGHRAVLNLPDPLVSASYYDEVFAVRVKGGVSAMPFPITEHVVKTKRHTTVYLACGASDAPLINFLHGWPELPTSWRHQ